MTRKRYFTPFTRIRTRLLRFSEQYEDWHLLKHEAVVQLSAYELHGIIECDHEQFQHVYEEKDVWEIDEWVNSPEFVRWLASAPEPKPEWLSKILVFEALKHIDGGTNL